jgi:hypothetical protein
MTARLVKSVVAPQERLEDFRRDFVRWTPEDGRYYYFRAASWGTVAILGSALAVLVSSAGSLRDLEIVLTAASYVWWVNVICFGMAFLFLGRGALAERDERNGKFRARLALQSTWLDVPLIASVACVLAVLG